MSYNRQHKNYPKTFPESWASDWGEDEYGVWMEFNYKGVEQRFRWCEPGMFMMGSPGSEEGRDNDEAQHEVFITKGFWLCEVAVSQAVWEMFMGNNPSEFRGADKPVDSVSWQDARSFIDKLNNMKPELQLSLPTETQWEYACRAGSETAFSFGDKDDLCLEKVNYSAQWDNMRENEGTKAVKSYLPNDWGFYQMHGNIYEWCQNTYKDYPIRNSAELTSDEMRVLRGGAWFNRGRYCRSACRFTFNTDVSDYNPGFRLLSEV